MKDRVCSRKGFIRVKHGDYGGQGSLG
jgi:hypothetical protein